MAARGKTHDPHMVGRHVPFRCSCAHDADCALRIAKFDRMVVPRAQPVFQNERGNPQRIQVVRDFTPFMIHRQRAVTASGANHNRQWRRPRAYCAACRWSGSACRGLHRPRLRARGLPKAGSSECRESLTERWGRSCFAAPEEQARQQHAEHDGRQGISHFVANHISGGEFFQ